MALYLAIDDTDIKGSRGTGKLARAIARDLSLNWPVTAVTRHQLLVHEAIPFTSHNSCAVIHIKMDNGEASDSVFERARQMILDDFIEGSDPGIAIASGSQVTPALIAFGKDAKTTVLKQESARSLAKNLSIRLEGLGGSEDGVIGAMAGLGLAATGNDGRFVQIGRIRDISGPCSAEDLLCAGVDAITTPDGRPVRSGKVVTPNGKSVKPCLIEGNSILFVEEKDGTWHAIKRD